MTSTEQREAAILAFAAQAQALFQQSGETPAVLEQIREMVAQLAARAELFPLEDFSLPTDGKSKRFYLHVGPDDRYALYLNTVLPGKSSYPHNHKTWAVVASVIGTEVNRRYRRRYDAHGEHAGLDCIDTVPVGPGSALLFGPEDIHSVHYEDTMPGIQIHYYGRTLESLSDRSGFHPDTGEELDYNRAVMRPTSNLPAA